MRHQPCVVALATLTAAAPLFAGCRAADPSWRTKPPISTSCAVALAPGPQRQEIDRTIGDLQARARQPGNTREVLEQLGYQYVARARLNNDPGDYTLAENTAACLESQHPGDSSALLLRGHALHQLHRFREAEAAAATLVARREFVLDYALLGDALMEQGRLADAARAYQRMIDLKPFYQSYTRAAHLRWLKGDVDGAIELIRKAIATASPRNRESVAWAYTRLASYELQRGRLSEAARGTESALTFVPDYAAALLVRGRALLALDRHAEALDALRRAVQINPLPEFQWLLADALRRAGRNDEAESVENDLMTRGSASDPRTLALFLATRRIDAPRAVSLTERELENRADVFTHDAYAWALAAAGRTIEARAAMARALAENTQDARLFLHAGAIAAAAGHRSEARRWLDKAEALRMTLFPSERDELHRQRTSNNTRRVQ